MCGLLWQDNIWPRYNYLKIWNLRVKKKVKILRKIAFKIVQIKFFAMHITYQNYVFIHLRYEIYKISSWNMIFT